MDDDVDGVLLDQPNQRVQLVDAAAFDAAAGRSGNIHRRDLMPAGGQRAADFGTDEAAAAGNQDVHGVKAAPFRCRILPPRWTSALQERLRSSPAPPAASAERLRNCSRTKAPRCTSRISTSAALRVRPRSSPRPVVLP